MGRNYDTGEWENDDQDDFTGDMDFAEPGGGISTPSVILIQPPRLPLPELRLA